MELEYKRNLPETPLNLPHDTKSKGKKKKTRKRRKKRRKKENPRVKNKTNYLYYFFSYNNIIKKELKEKNAKNTYF